MRVPVAVFGLVLALVPSLRCFGQAADLIIHGAAVETLAPAPGDRAEAVAVQGGRIVAVGASRDILAAHRGASTRVIDAAGRQLIPGLIDSHGHFAGIGRAAEIDMSATRSYAEVVAWAKTRAAKLPPGAWVVGRGWDQNRWPDKNFPAHGPLSAAIPDRPVFLERVDGHAALVNAAAMSVVGLGDDVASVAGGEFLRDANGKLTGVLIDKATNVVERAMPERSDAEIEADLLAAQKLCLDYGITSFHDAGAGFREIVAMNRLYAAKKLKIRLYVMLGSSGARAISSFADEAPTIGAFGGRLTIRAIKLGVDGALGSRGAALLEDYADRRGHRGLGMIGKKELVEIGAMALERGYQVAVHAIGDAGNRVVVEAWEELAKADPKLKEARFRVEHAQIVDAADIPRFKALGLIASMQGVHCTSDMPWVPDRIGPERTAEGAYVWRKFLDAGVLIANGTDAPVERLSPFECLFASITRRRPDGTPEGGWQPDQRMTPIEALRSYTAAGAYAAFEEKEKGTIEIGKVADLVLVDRPLTGADARAVLEAKAVLTVLAGEIVAESK